MTIIKATIILVLVASLASFSIPVLAQAADAVPTSGEVLPGLEETQKELANSKAEANNPVAATNSESELQNKFITGVAVGGLIGVVLGGALIWFLKPVEA